MNQEVIRTIENDITLVYIQASSFPDGIGKAFATLGAATNGMAGRHFGLSRPENGNIIYLAACEIQAGAGLGSNLPTIIVPAGTYASILINDFMSRPTAIKEAFEQLIQRKDIAVDGYCVEEYINSKNVWCMVRLS